MNTITLESKGVTFWGDMIGRPVIILISGKAGVGKSTLAELLYDEIDAKFNKVIRGFAYGVKMVASQCFGWDGSKDEKGRKLLQNIGNTGRDYDKDFWVKNLIEYIDKTEIFFPDIVIIEDWRFPNEATYLENGLYSIFKVRIISSIRGGLVGRAGMDISEIALDEYNDYDYVIKNDYKSIKEFKKEAKFLAEDILKKEKDDE